MHLLIPEVLIDGLCWPCRFIEGSLGFLSGLVSLAELIPLARQHRDKMLFKVLSSMQCLVVAASHTCTDRCEQELQLAYAIASTLPVVLDCSCLHVLLSHTWIICNAWVACPCSYASTLGFACCNMPHVPHPSLQLLPCGVFNVCHTSRRRICSWPLFHLQAMQRLCCLQ